MTTHTSPGSDATPVPAVAVVAGASGFIGRHLVDHLRAAGTEVRTIGRGASDDAGWHDDAALDRVLDGADLVLNLAGRSVSCRYTKRTVDEIFSSRIDTTAALGRAVGRMAAPPRLWANASTGTIYRDARDRPQDEATGELGTGMSVAVARAWEHELFAAPTDARRVALRIAIVLGDGGGAIEPILALARLGLGGRMGDGEQVFSWVHVDDVVGAILHAYAHEEVSGPVNVATPDPVTNAGLMSAVRAAVGRNVGLVTPAWLLEVGSRLIRTETELVLKSRWVHPGALLTSGFTFVHPDLQGALAAIVGMPRAGTTTPDGPGQTPAPGEIRNVQLTAGM